MKKVYAKPTLEVDSFQLDADIATSDCSWLTLNDDQTECKLDFETPDTNDGKCYHSYVEAGAFTS